MSTHLFPRLIAALGIGLSLYFTSATLIDSLPTTAPAVLLVFAVFLQIAQYFYTRPGQRWWLCLAVVLLYVLSVSTSYLFLDHTVHQALAADQDAARGTSAQQAVVDELRKKLDLERGIITDLNNAGYHSKALKLLNESTTEGQLARALQALSEAPSGPGAVVVSGVPDWALKSGLFLLSLVLELIIAGALAESWSKKVAAKAPVTPDVPEARPVVEKPLVTAPEPVKRPEKPAVSAIPPIAVLESWPDNELVTIANLRDKTQCTEREARAALQVAKDKKWLIKDGKSWRRKRALKAV